MSVSLELTLEDLGLNISKFSCDVVLILPSPPGEAFLVALQLPHKRLQARNFPIERRKVLIDVTPAASWYMGGAGIQSRPSWSRLHLPDNARIREAAGESFENLWRYQKSLRRLAVSSLLYSSTAWKVSSASYSRTHNPSQTSST